MVTLYHTIQLIDIIKDELIVDYLLGIMKKYQYDSSTDRQDKGDEVIAVSKYKWIKTYFRAVRKSHQSFCNLQIRFVISTPSK